MRRECRERFPHHQLLMKPLVSNPGMHHGTCVTRVPWCMSGSLTRGGEENDPGILCAILLVWQEAHFRDVKITSWHGSAPRVTGLLRENQQVWVNPTHKGQWCWRSELYFVSSFKNSWKIVNLSVNWDAQVIAVHITQEGIYGGIVSFMAVCGRRSYNTITQQLEIFWHTTKLGEWFNDNKFGIRNRSEVS